MTQAHCKIYQAQIEKEEEVHRAQDIIFILGLASTGLESRPEPQFKKNWDVLGKVLCSCPNLPSIQDIGDGVGAELLTLNILKTFHIGMLTLELEC